MKRLKRLLALKRRNALLVTMAKLMRKHGASDSSIRKALPELEEFARFVDKELSNPAPPQPEHPQPDADPDAQAPGVFLSQVQAQPTVPLASTTTAAINLRLPALPVAVRDRGAQRLVAELRDQLDGGARRAAAVVGIELDVDRTACDVRVLL